MGPFMAQTAVPASFTWNQLQSLNFVSRSSGVTVTWTGGAPGSLVQITGMSSADFGSVALTTYFTCSALADAGKFTVPPAVTLSLPPTAVLSGLVSASFMSVTNYTNPEPFSATGIDFGIVYGYINDTTTDISNFQFQ